MSNALVISTNRWNILRLLDCNRSWPFRMRFWVRIVVSLVIISTTMQRDILERRNSHGSPNITTLLTQAAVSPDNRGVALWMIIPPWLYPEMINFVFGHVVFAFSAKSALRTYVSPVVPFSKFSQTYRFAMPALSLPVRYPSTSASYFTPCTASLDFPSRSFNASIKGGPANTPTFPGSAVPLANNSV